MKALMFGWEFPPHILGGLGTASYGLTRGMAQQEDMQITFIAPGFGDDEGDLHVLLLRHATGQTVTGCT